ncbi:MAG: alcohol dehydrogenase catalytic domain-containing protein [bacterium]|nr:alcohol dehydrogenase catalytic domain-containing protein [bacterium]
MESVQLIAPGAPLQMRDVDSLEPDTHDVVIDVRAAGVCRSDVHYRSGFPRVGPLPLTLGHEVAGVVATTGSAVTEFAAGDRVCIHYQVGCGTCRFCDRRLEMFCPDGKMIGNGRPGGYARQIMVPDRNVVAVPDAVSLEHAAVMMCSSATSLHALRKARLSEGETVAVFGAGGLGMSAIQLAFLEGATSVYAVDINPSKLDASARLGATPIDATANPVQTIIEDGGVDIALDLVGSAAVMHQCLESLAPMGRAIAVGLTPDTFPVGPYVDLVYGESELIGASDHLLAEIVELLGLAAAGRLLLDDVVQDTVPLEEGAINTALDDLERFGDTVRTVITPG